MDCRALPKAELHCHLDGSLRPRTVLELTEAAGMPLGVRDEAELLKKLHAGEVRQSLEDYLTGFAITLAALQTEAALERAAYELAVDCAAENVLRLETRFSPALHRTRGLHDEAIMEAVLAGLRRGEKETGISAGVIVCAIRDMAPTVSLALATLAVSMKDRGVCGFDLAGPEQGFPASAHQQAFDLAYAAGLGITVHAGEAEGAWAVGEAMRAQHATRVGHGTHLIDDPALMAEAKAKGLALEVCLQSNVETQSVASLDAHPFATMLRAGLVVTLNTDNRLMSATDLSSEYARAAAAFHLTRKELLDVAFNGLNAAFIPTSERARLQTVFKQRAAQL